MKPQRFLPCIKLICRKRNFSLVQSIHVVVIRISERIFVLVIGFRPRHYQSRTLEISDGVDISIECSRLSIIFFHMWNCTTSAQLLVLKDFYHINFLTGSVVWKLSFRQGVKLLYSVICDLGFISHPTYPASQNLKMAVFSIALLN